MSASEKLKALEAQIEEFNSIGSLDQFERYIGQLQDALPQIVAVVEAAEQIERGPIFVGSRLGDSLAALDEALTTRTEGTTL